MDTITISKKEYRRLVAAERKNVAVKTSKKVNFFDAAFGILKNTFGNKSSVGYVATLRKSWR